MKKGTTGAGPVKLINESRLDLACGQNKQEGYFGIDIFPGKKVDAVVDLEIFPWPIESNSADEIVCSHYVEHTPKDTLAKQLFKVMSECSTYEELKARIAKFDENAPTDGLIKFMNEIYRILKPGGKLKVVAPYYNSIRCWQDPTHTRAINEATFLYYNKEWRVVNKLDHYPINCDFDFCVSPETLVLTSDLKWVRADSVNVGDSIVGVDEFIPGKGLHRRMINSTVEFTRNFEHKRYKVITDCGEIVVTPEHPFLTKRNKSVLKWIPSADLKTGDRIKFVGDPWTEDCSDSWLSGMLDGEGCLVLPNMNDRYTGINLTISQNPGPVLDRSIDILKSEIESGKVGLYDKGDGTNCKTLCTSGIAKTIKILGKYRPIRLLDKFKTILDSGKLGLPKEYATVIGIEPLEDGTVVAIRTSTKTLITNGLISHNTYGYDMNAQWATRADDARNFGTLHYNNVINDIHVVLTKRG